MAKTAKKKQKANKKSARVTAKSSASKAMAKAKGPRKAAKKTPKPAPRKSAPKIDPLNRKSYTSITPMLTVRDVRGAAEFYIQAFGFKQRAIMNGPDGSPMHAELRLRDTTLMLGPENPQMQNLSANRIGGTPATLYVTVENVDKVFQAAVAAGGRVLMPVMDMFWGDRCCLIGDPDGNRWMIATHRSEPTEAQMKKAMAEQMQQMPIAGETAAGAAAIAGSESQY